MSALTHILLVDDDRETCVLLSKFLQRRGYRVSVAYDGKAMLQTLQSARVDLVVLDLMLPGEDGLSLCRRLRATCTLPIIMLTAMGEVADRIVGLEMGADDYLVKAADPRELLARIRAVLRRAGAAEPGSARARRVLEFASWRLDVAQRQLYSPAGALIPLRSSEFELLLALAERPQRVMTRDQLLDIARGRSPSDALDRSIDVLISRLRRKIEEDPAEPALIRTVRGGGYLLSATVTTHRTAT